MSAKLRVGVAGAGVFGGYHAAKYKSLEDLNLANFIGVYDLELNRAQQIAQTHGVSAFGGDDFAHFLTQIEAITIATPAFAHAQIARAALHAGVHVYSEKPLTICVEDGQELVDLAREKGLVLACGHQERAIFEAMGLYNIKQRPIRLEAVRNGTLATRNLDVSVTLDLMIHDLDLGISLSQGEAGGVKTSAKYHTADGYKAVGADEMDAEVAFDNGFSAHFSASRMAPMRQRSMRVIYENGEINIDFLNRVFENTTPFSLDANFADAPIAKDPLGTSVTRFLQCINKQIETPLCSGDEALMALTLALAIDLDAH